MRIARKNNKLSQKTVSYRLGISQSALSKMENGKLIPSAVLWFEFCRLTEISPDSLRTGEVEHRAMAYLRASLPF